MAVSDAAAEHLAHHGWRDDAGAPAPRLPIRTTAARPPPVAPQVRFARLIRMVADHPADGLRVEPDRALGRRQSSPGSPVAGGPADNPSSSCAEVAGPAHHRGQTVQGGIRRFTGSVVGSGASPAGSSSSDGVSAAGVSDLQLLLLAVARPTRSTPSAPARLVTGNGVPDRPRQGARRRDDPLLDILDTDAEPRSEARPLKVPFDLPSVLWIVFLSRELDPRRRERRHVDRTAPLGETDIDTVRPHAGTSGRDP